MERKDRENSLGMEDKRIKILRDMDTGKAVSKLSMPATVGFMVMGIYNVVDTIFVSWWNYKGAGAVQIIFPLMMVSSAVGLTLGVGGGSFISRLLGKNDTEEANAVVTTSLITGLIIGFLYVIPSLIYMEPLLRLFGAEGEMLDFSMQYGKYILMGSLFVILSMIFNNALRAEGSAKFSMLGMGIGSLINIALDPLFIFTFQMGIEGAAIATLLSQGISFALLFHFYLRKKTLLRLSPGYFKPSLKMYAEISKIGLPTFFRQILFSISMGLLNEGARKLGGDYLLSAMAIALKVSSVQGFIIFGLGQGLQPVVGYNYGAGNMERVFSAQKHGFIKTLRISAILALLMTLFARQVMGLFTAEREVIEYGVLAIRSLSFASIFMGISNTVGVVFQSVGHAKAALLFSVLRQGFFLIPAIQFLPIFYGSVGLIHAQLVADVLTVFASVLVYVPYLKAEKAKATG